MRFEETEGANWKVVPCVCICVYLYRFTEYLLFLIGWGLDELEMSELKIGTLYVYTCIVVYIYVVPIISNWMRLDELEMSELKISTLCVYVYICIYLQSTYYV